MKNADLIKKVALLTSAGMLFTACSSMREHNEDDYSYYPSSSASGHSGQYSSAEEDSVIVEGSGAQSSDAQYQSQSSTASQDQDQINIPLHEERLNVGKRTVDAGQVTIRKVVTTETVNQPVQLRKESLVIDRNTTGNQNVEVSSSSNFESADAQTQNQSNQQQLSSDAQASLENDIVNEPAGASRQSNAADSSSNLNSGNAFQEESFTIRLQEEQPVIEKTVIQTGRVTARKNSEMQQQSVQQQVRREDVKLDRSAAQNVEIRGNFDSAGSSINEPSGAQRSNSLQQNQPSQSERDLEDRRPTQGQGARDLQQKDQRPQNNADTP